MSTTRQVTVREISNEDIQRLADGETIQGYLGYVDGMLPVTMSARTFRGRIGDPIYPAEPIVSLNLKHAMGDPTHRTPRDTDGLTEVGQQVKVEMDTIFGSTHSRTLYTTREAERQHDLTLYDSDRRAAEGREFVFVDDPDGQEFHTVPVYGSQVSLTLFVADVDHEEALARVEAALEAAFTPEEKMRIRRPQSRPVHDHRVNVLDFTSHQLLAANMLDAEAQYAEGVTFPFETQPVQSSGGIEIGA